ncbi:hypothetical protein DBR11_00295 [Pedobacter sp. HMWF019]|uniref:DUF1295 domain-containing protein n=1 Tax=Pedobacter sp. HMWF019 TaxID=2056856 RepID=UPI000D3BA604|nr:DUF1295 domain-containing protein [Pedobacter sp. HMWF019]PTT04169.1 hypothetical protein DBR11_00295 [Pedobacter sp. HMWF019]
MSVFVLIFICLVVCCLVMTGVWFWAEKIGNAGVVDVFWALNFPVIGIVLYFLANGLSLRKELICSMVVLAGLRLGLHLGKRVFSHLNEEEGRYLQLRKEWAAHGSRNFFWFFQFQAISNVVLAIPFFLIAMNTQPEIHFLEYIGMGLWCVAFVGEAVADAQLTKFKSDLANKGEVCAVGLWSCSRHPNYFFQSLLWTSYFLIAVTAPLGWLAVLSPLIILYLLFRVTGIPATEEQALRSKGEKYRMYQKTTSVFIPWFKKKNRVFNP